MARYLPVLVALALLVARFIELRMKHDKVPGQVKETGTLNGFVIAGLVLVLGGVTEYLMLGRDISPASFGVGLVLIAASILLRRSAIRALGKMWSFHVEIRERHELVVAGPFRWIRHPAYCAMILEYAAVLVLLRSYASFALAVLLFLPAYLRRIKIEERALAEKFGERYVEYRRRTPMLVPYRIPRDTD